MSYLDLLKLALPETIVLLGALAALVADSTMRGLAVRFRFLIGGMIAAVGCAAAIAWMLLAPGIGSAPGGMLAVDPLTQLVQIALLVLTIFTVLISMNRISRNTSGNISP